MLPIFDSGDKNTFVSVFKHFKKCQNTSRFVEHFCSEYLGLDRRRHFKSREDPEAVIVSFFFVMVHRH